MKAKNKDFFTMSLFIASTLLFIFTCIFFYELKLKNEVLVESLVHTFFFIGLISSFLFSLNFFLMNGLSNEKKTKGNLILTSLNIIYMILLFLFFILSYVL